MRTKGIALVLAIGLTMAACSGGDDDDTATTAATETTESADGGDTATTASTDTTAAVETTEPSTTTAATPADAALVTAIETALGEEPDPGCDPLDTRECYLPYPSNAHTVPDEGTVTGLRVNLPLAGAPVNAQGVAIDPAEWNRNDGFSPNSTILTRVANLDAAASKLPAWTDIARSLEDSAPVVVVDTESGDRVPLWAEPDARVTDPADTLLNIHPAVALTEGHTYAVALRGLVDTSGVQIEASPVFTAYRDNLTTELPTIENRRPEMDAMFTALDGAGVARDELQLAWTFTVASSESITGRMVAIRDAALTALGTSSPQFAITETVEPAEGEGLARQIHGTLTVPNFLTGDGAPGNRFNYADTAPGSVPADPDALPVANGELQATFACNISTATMSGTEPAHLVIYGHGLLGKETEVDAQNIRDMSNEHNTVYCATKWAGMSADDIPNATTVLADFSLFPSLADRLQQGFVNQVTLGRLMLAADGLAADPAFQRPDGSPLIDTSTLVYDGNSLGGILGLALTAISPDFERAVLGVPGMNFSMLLPRSKDFDLYESIMVPAYTDPLERTMIISMAQMLWDRGEAGGYVHHVTTDRLPGVPEKQVLMHVAYGDQQVSEIAALVEARSLGIPIHRPVNLDGREQEVEPGWGLESIAYPSTGSGIVIWDSGSGPMPFENVPPRETRDSHEDPRFDPEARVQKSGFLFDGQLIDVCDGAACTAIQATD